MVLGASMADISVLVVSASKNEHDIEYIKEHSLISYYMGSKYFIVVINKIETIEYN